MGKFSLFLMKNIKPYYFRSKIAYLSYWFSVLGFIIIFRNTYSTLPYMHTHVCMYTHTHTHTHTHTLSPDFFLFLFFCHASHNKPKFPRVYFWNWAPDLQSDAWLFSVCPGFWSGNWVWDLLTEPWCCSDYVHHLVPRGLAFSQDQGTSDSHTAISHHFPHPQPITEV